jgi:hypothetical protein
VFSMHLTSTATDLFCLNVYLYVLGELLPVKMIVETLLEIKCQRNLAAIFWHDFFLRPAMLFRSVWCCCAYARLSRAKALLD